MHKKGRPADALTRTGTPVERALLDSMLAAIRAELGEAAFAAAWSVAQTTPLEQVIAEALAESPAGRPTDSALD